MKKKRNKNKQTEIQLLYITQHGIKLATRIAITIACLTSSFPYQRTEDLPEKKQNGTETLGRVEPHSPTLKSERLASTSQVG